jgi:hypothetical protein
MSPSRIRIARRTALGVLLACVAVAAGPPTSYRFQALQAPGPGYTEPAAFGINTAGTIVGNMTDDEDNIVGYYGLRNAFFPIRIEGASFIQLARVNERGTAVGLYFGADETYYPLIVRRDGRTETPPPIAQGVDTAFFGINDRGIIVGHYSTDDFATAHGFVYRDGVYLPFDPPGSVYTVPWEVTNKGIVVGWYNDEEGVGRGFIFDPKTGFSDYEVPVPGARFTTVYGTNERGDLAGSTSFDDPELGRIYRGFVVRGGVFQFVDYPDVEDTDCFDITDNGRIVGTSDFFTFGWVAEPRGR